LKDGWKLRVTLFRGEHIAIGLYHEANIGKFSQKLYLSIEEVMELLSVLQEMMDGEENTN
jgi:hypothetical protein